MTNNTDKVALKYVTYLLPKLLMMSAVFELIVTPYHISIFVN
jgi:hypothetical protein